MTVSVLSASSSAGAGAEEIEIVGLAVVKVKSGQRRAAREKEVPPHGKEASQNIILKLGQPVQSVEESERGPLAGEKNPELAAATEICLQRVPATGHRLVP